MDMSERIEQAKRKAEQEYTEKLHRSQESDIDVRDFFSDEELMRILESESIFHGNVADLTKLQRFEKLATAAKWMEANSIEVTGVEIEKPTPGRPNVVVSMTVNRLCSFRGKELGVMTLMHALSDTVFLSSIKDEGTKFSFGLESVWQEGMPEG